MKNITDFEDLLKDKSNYSIVELGDTKTHR